MQREQKIASLKTLNAEIQAQIAIVLLSIVPVLSLCYVCITVLNNPERLSFGVILFITVLILVLAFSGFMILQKYPKNIIKIRKYITQVAQETLPEDIQLVQTRDSDDLQYIEENFNRILDEMRHQTKTAEKQLRVEQELRKINEKQKEELQTVVRTLAAACHHIGQPATVLQIEIDLLVETANDNENGKRIVECAQEIQRISDILQRLQRTREFQSIRYIDFEDPF